MDFDSPPEVKKVCEERELMKQKYPKLFASISAICFRQDPIGINFSDNTDEYDPEAGTILPRLKECRNKEDVRKIVCEEFIRWFGSEIVGEESKYQIISEEIWKAWRESLEKE